MNLAEVLVAHWPDARLVERAPRGHVNEVWFAVVDGVEAVARVSRRSAPALDWELDLAESLTEGLRVPRVISSVDGRRHVEGVVIQTRLTGQAPQSVQDWRLVGEFLEALHTAKSEVGQRPGFTSAGELADAGHGGDIDLRRLPGEAAELCRAAWLPLADLPMTVVHGDPGASNILIDGGTVGLVDWDEARVDCAWFDLAALPPEVCPLSSEELRLAQQAVHAWEAAISWNNDREYAEWRLSQLRS